MQMRRILASFFIILLAIGIIWGVNRLTDRFPKGPRYAQLDILERQGLPEFEAVQISGEKFSASDLKYPVVIINFWASWCDPCVAEYPSMVKLVEHFKGQLGLIAISADQDKKDIETFLKSFGGIKPNIEILWDSEMKIASQFGTIQLPESYIFKRDKKLVRKIVGLEDWYNPDSIEFFAKLVAESENAGEAQAP